MSPNQLIPNPSDAQIQLMLKDLGFFWWDRALLQFIEGDICTAYLTLTTPGSQSANLELLLSGHRFTLHTLFQILAAHHS